MAYSEDDIAELVQSFATRQEQILSYFYDHARGTVNGGPNGDGMYPMPVGVGRTELVPCVARMDFDARRMPRVRLAGANSITLDPALHHGRWLSIVGATASSTVTVHIPQSIPAEFYCMFAAAGSGRLVFDFAGDGFLRHDQGFDRTRGAYSVGGLYVDSKDSAFRPTVFLYGSLVAA